MLTKLLDLKFEALKLSDLENSHFKKKWLLGFKEVVDFNSTCPIWTQIVLDCLGSSNFSCFSTGHCRLSVDNAYGVTFGDEISVG
jgi:hypothetical protein